MIDPDLLDCFKPIPLPVQRGDQTYQPSDSTWYEAKFCHKVTINRSHRRDWEVFQKLKSWMSLDSSWGVYREDWFCCFAPLGTNWYFMDSDHADRFNKSGRMAFGWNLPDFSGADPSETYVRLVHPTGEQMASSVLWAKERLGPQGHVWGYFPQGAGFRDIIFYFNDSVDRDVILLFKLAWGGK